MASEAIILGATAYEPIRCSEEKLERLIAAAGKAAFPGLTYLDFKPAIRCGDGTRHPDGVLVAEGETNWWVVEVETHLHDVETHIGPQLLDLSSGYYGPDAFRYLERHRGFESERYPVDTYDPSFLLVVDTVTPQIRQAATNANFAVCECSVFRSVGNRYALSMGGARPSTADAGRQPGLDLALDQVDGVACLRPVDGRPLPALKTTELVIGDGVIEGFVLEGGSGIVLGLGVTELQNRVGSGTRFRMLADGRLIAASTPR